MTISIPGVRHFVHADGVSNPLSSTPDPSPGSPSPTGFDGSGGDDGGSTPAPDLALEPMTLIIIDIK